MLYGIHYSPHIGIVGTDIVNEEAASCVEILTLARNALASSVNVPLRLN
jgi:hypothetical protein